MKSKLVIAVIIACLMLSFSGLVYAAELTDLTGHWAQSQVEKMIVKGVVYGYPDGTFKPDRQISRAEFTVIANNAFAKFNQNATTNFSDVQPSYWAYKHIASGQAAGYIAGYPGNKFKPDNSISRAEVASILAKMVSLDTTKTDAANSFTDKAKIENWAKGSIAAVADAKIMSGYPDGSFQPEDSITRAEALVAVDKAMSYTKPVVYSGGGGDHGSSGGGGTTPVTPSIITNALLNRVLFMGNTYLYSIKGDVTSNVYRIGVAIGSEQFTVIPENGKFTAERAVDGVYAAATLTAKAVDGTILATVTVTIAGDGNSGNTITNLVATKAAFVGNTYLYSVKGDVSSSVYTVEVTIGAETFTVTPANGKFSIERAVDGNNANAVIKAKAADGTIIKDVTVAFSSNSGGGDVVPENPGSVITNIIGSKAPFMGNTFLYSVKGDVTSNVSSLEVTIGSDTFTVAPANGKFTAERAVDGNYSSAVIKAKTAEGTVIESDSANF